MIDRRAMLATALAMLTPNAFAGVRKGKPAPIPSGYLVMGRIHGVPPSILYGVALQESKMKFGEHALPYPWTLNVQGVAKRYPSYVDSVNALRKYVHSGVKSVDCCLMQVNWLYHHEKLGSFWSAMDPYPNIGVGARLLRGHFFDTKSWFSAIARYHNANPSIGEPYARAVLRLIADIPNQPHFGEANHA